MKFDKNTQIPVMEHFYTIQGEGIHTGKAAYFIRLAGCDVGCTWCDVKESWNVHKEQLINIFELVKQILDFPTKLVVITGGEPLMYDLNPLTKALKSSGFQINIETSGAYPISGTIDWICLSPKKFKAPLESCLAKANELKIIVFNKSDFNWAKKFIEFVPQDCNLLVQPEWDKRDKNIPLIIDFVKSNPRWKISLQTHKYLNIP